MAKLVRRLFAQDLGLKLFSLVMATVLWAAVTHDREARKTFSVPVEFQSLPDTLAINSAPPALAQVAVSGTSQRVDDLKGSDVHVAVDLSGAHPGTSTFTLDPYNVRLPRGLQAVQVEPERLSVDFDRRKVRMLQVRPRVLATLANGAAMDIVKVLIEPEQVEVSGPEKRVDALIEATTDPLDATGVLTQHTFETSAYVSDPLVQVRPQPIRVTLVMAKSTASGR